MLIIKGDRGSGKTTALVSVFLNDKSGTAVLIFANESARQAAFRSFSALRVRNTTVAGDGLDRSLQGTDGALYVDDYFRVKLPDGAINRVVAYSTEMAGHDRNPVPTAKQEKPATAA
jgi:hypothetical protein